MPPESLPSRLRLLLVLSLQVAALVGCAVTPPPVPTPAPPPPVAAVPSPPPEPPPAPPARPATDGDIPVLVALGYGDRLRVLSGSELSAELQRLAGQLPVPMVQMQTAMALSQTRVPADTQRAVQLLQRLLGQDSQEARALHPLARLLTAQLSEQRRLEEQSDRQVQQLRDALRRIDQLTDRLDALRAIERDRPARIP